MHTTTQKLMLQGGLILLGALVVSSIGGWARRATADDQPAPLTAPALIGELRSLEQALEATPGAACLQPRAGEGAGAARRREGPTERLCGGPYERLSSKKLKT